MENTIDAVYCINLESSTDRLSKFLDNFKRYGHPNLIIFPAVEGGTLIIDDWPGNAGELGCRQSHINVLKKAFYDNANIFMVVEDDIQFPKKFKQNLSKFLEEVGTDWDMLYLYMENHFIKPERITKNVYKLKNTLGLVAIIYHKRCVELVLDKIENDFRWVDSSMADLHLTLKAYGPKKSLVKHRNGFSTIAQKKIRYRKTLIEIYYQRGINLFNKVLKFLK